MSAVGAVFTQLRSMASRHVPLAYAAGETWAADISRSYVKTIRETA